MAPSLITRGSASASGFGFSKGRGPVTLSNTFAVPGSSYVIGDTITFSKGTGVTNFPVYNGKQFTISLYGAGGGSIASGTGTGGNANGGILIATIDLSSYANTTLYLVRGGGGYNSQSGVDGNCGSLYAGGYNGGGNGGGTRGPGGGGRTDLRTVSGTTTSELLVAGGGGGGYSTMAASGTRYQGAAGCTGDFGGYCGDNGGGGGGYYGGSSSCSDDGSDAGSGTNYYDAGKTISVATNSRFTTTTGGNSGDGYFVVQVVSI